MRYSYLLAAFLLLALVTLGACGDSDSVLLGYVGPLTGKYSDLGVQGRNGVRLAVEQFNDAGGLQGVPVKLRVENDFSTPEGALEACRKLASQRVRAVIGPMTSGQALAAWTIMEDYGVVVISPTVATPSVSHRADFFFRVIATNENWARSLAEYAAETLHLRTVVTVGDADNAEYVDTFNSAFVDRFVELGGSVSEGYTFSSSVDSTWEPLLEILKQHEPDALLLETSARDAADIAQQVALHGLSIQLLGPTWPASRELLFAGGPAVEGAVFATGFTEKSDLPEQLAFEREYVERYGYRPNFAAAFGYESARILLRGLSADAFSPADFSRFLLRAGEFPGVYGALRFDEYGDVVRETVLLQVRNGEFVSLRRGR